ncbi:MAG: FecR family protein [Myxococcota bacterium]|nr:FecR family protein [Myxococcota bacterium]
MSNVRPPVEPMSDLSWARVERGLWSRLDGTVTTQIAPPPSRRWLWIALPSVAVAAAAAAVFAFAIDTPKALPTAPVALVEETPMRVVSGASPSTITVGDAHVTLDAESAVVMPRGGANESTAVLERGAAWFAIAPRTNREFIVVAGDAVVRVIGTKFRVARSEERVTVEVERGLVDVTFQGSTVKIAAGEKWDSSPAKPVVDRAAIIEPDTKPAVVVEKKRVPTAKAQAPSVRADDDEQAKYWRAVALEARDPGTALASYLELARGTSTWARNSLYAAARLSADRGETRAKTLLDMYLRRFPRGANAADARKLLDRLKGAP